MKHSTFMYRLDNFITLLENKRISIKEFKIKVKALWEEYRSTEEQMED